MTQTPNFQLNQWSPEDYVRRTDFNADNAKIDAALKAVAEGGAKIIIGSYTGTGDSTDTTVTVGFPIKALIITTGNQLDGHNGLFVTSGQTVSGGVTGQVLWFTDTGFRVKTAMYSGEACPPYLNTATHIIMWQSAENEKVPLRRAGLPLFLRQLTL